MSKESTSRAAKRFFVSDPRYGVALKVSDTDTNRLWQNRWLGTNFLDYLVQRGIPKEERTSDDRIIVGSAQTLEDMNSLLDSHQRVLNNQSKQKFNVDKNRDDTKRITKARERMEGYRSGTYRFLMPHCTSGHFFVVDIAFDCGNKNTVYKHAKFYDSMRYSRRGGAFPENSNIGKFLKSFNAFVQAFLFDNDRNRDVGFRALLEIAEVKTCPLQKNSFDCGLFSFATLLHLMDGIEITRGVFGQDEIDALRAGLAAKCEERDRDFISREYLRSFFPALTDTPAAIELLGRREGAAVKEEESDDMEDADADEDKVKHDDETEEEKVQHDDDETEEEKQSVMEESSPVGSPVGSLVKDLHADIAVEEYLDDKFLLHFDSYYNDLNEIDSLMADYESESNIRTRIVRSEKDRFRRYACASHFGCSFFAQFGRRRSDGCYVLKKHCMVHKGRQVPERSKAGRRWKERKKLDLDSAVDRVVDAKEARPVAKDVMKSAARAESKVISYNQAYRAIQSTESSSMADVLKTAELVVPYLLEFQEQNADSVCSHSIDGNTQQLENIFICPGIMNRSLQYVRPIMSLDAAHMKSRLGGTLYFASVQTPMNDLYPIAVALTAKNESQETWTWFCQHLLQACPFLISEHPSRTVTKKRFTFISDRDKGLKEALQSVFPDNHSMSCLVHIQRNVQQRFGRQASEYVGRIGRTSSARQEDLFFCKLRTFSPKAADYLGGIPGEEWRGTFWVSDNTLPPRYGVTTSNMSEACNNMFEDAREAYWFDAIDIILNKMLDRISTLRSKVENTNYRDIVPMVKKKVEENWDKSASCNVVHIDPLRPLYKVSRTSDDTRRAVVSHLVNTTEETCTCGDWQQYGIPCWHATAYYRLHAEKQLDWFIRTCISPLYCCGFQKDLLSQNIRPVIIESLQYDGKTKYADDNRLKRQRGRPTKKRLRKRSKFTKPQEQSPIVCAACGQRGHNKRTCERRQEEQKQKQQQNDTAEANDLL